MQFEAFDTDYLERLRSGHPEAEAHFVRYFSELIRIKVRGRLRSAHAVEDVRQETFLRVLRNLRAPGGIRHPERLGAYVHAVGENVRAEVRRAEMRVVGEPPPMERPDPLPTPETAFLSEDGRRVVREVIRDLPPRDRDLLQAFFVDDKEKDEICDRLGVTRDYLRVLLHRAKLLFRDRYLHQPAGAGLKVVLERVPGPSGGRHGAC